MRRIITAGAIAVTHGPYLWQLAIRGWLILGVLRVAVRAGLKPERRLVNVVAVRHPNVDAIGNGNSGKEL